MHYLKLYQSGNKKLQEMNMYLIFIDDELYESAGSYEVAKYLYNTVDATCLAKYNGHRKSLVARIDGTDHHLQRGIISKSPEDIVVGDVVLCLSERA